MSVMMIRPVVASGSRQELKDLGGQIIADQSREIEQMHGWPQGWYGLDATCPMASCGPMTPGVMTGTMPSWMPGLSSERHDVEATRPGSMLPGAGMLMMTDTMPGSPIGTMPMMAGFPSLQPEQFDATFMTWMIAHHQGAIDMTRLVPDRAAYRELRDLATSTIKSQSAEVDRMNGWLSSWYSQ